VCHTSAIERRIDNRREEQLGKIVKLAFVGFALFVVIKTMSASAFLALVVAVLLYFTASYFDKR